MSERQRGLESRKTVYETNGTWTPRWTKWEGREGEVNSEQRFNLLEHIRSTMKSEIRVTLGGLGTLFSFLWETFPFS